MARIGRESKGIEATQPLQSPLAEDAPKPARRSRNNSTPAGQIETALPEPSTNRFSGAYGAATRTPLAENDPRRGPYGVRLAVDPSAARQQIDALITKVSSAENPKAQAARLEELRAYLSSVGPDVVDAIRVGDELGQQGVGYVNARLRELGLHGFESAMDGRTRAFLNEVQPGKVHGARAGLRIDFTPFSADAVAAAASVGVATLGDWSVTLEGREAWSNVADQFGYSGKLRDFSSSTSGWSQPLRATVDSMCAKLKDWLPKDFTLEADLSAIPAEQHAYVREALQGFDALGAIVIYKDAPATDQQLVRDMQNLALLSGRIQDLLQKNPRHFSPAESAELDELRRVYLDAEAESLARAY